VKSSSKAEATSWIHALLLSSQPFREKDRIVRLLCVEHGKLSTIAHSAAVSKKRFPPALLEGFNLLKVDLKAPRGGEENVDGAIWTLNGAELKQSYDHFRVGYQEIELGVFPLKLIVDLIPDGPIDPVLFKTLGRYLRDSAVLNLKQVSWWLPVAFWTWFAHFQGFGDLTEEMERVATPEEESFWQLWHAALAKPEADFQLLFKRLPEVKIPPLGQTELRVIYNRWLELSGMHWKHFEVMIGL
jgi:hypothetical protein